LSYSWMRDANAANPEHRKPHVIMVLLNSFTSMNCINHDVTMKDYLLLANTISMCRMLFRTANRTPLRTTCHNRIFQEKSYPTTVLTKIEFKMRLIMNCLFLSVLLCLSGVSFAINSNAKVDLDEDAEFWSRVLSTSMLSSYGDSSFFGFPFEMPHGGNPPQMLLPGQCGQECETDKDCDNTCTKCSLDDDLKKSVCDD